MITTKTGLCGWIIGLHGAAALVTLALVAFAMNVSSVRAEPFFYVTNNGNDTVSVIDTATNSITATVPVGARPSGVAITPDGSFAYVVSSPFFRERTFTWAPLDFRF